MNKTDNCPKCQGELVQGFIPDLAFAQAVVGHWYKGPPRTHYSGDMKVPALGGLPIAAFRCSQCGYLELYADKEYAAS
jgi:hypothetical protein